MKIVCIIKPDIIEEKKEWQLMDKLQNIFVMLDINIDFMFYYKFSVQDIEEFYFMHKQKDFFLDLKVFMTSFKCLNIIADIISDKIVLLRDFIGDTDPKKARKNSIRAIFGSNIGRNAIHCSANEKDGQKESILMLKILKNCLKYSN